MAGRLVLVLGDQLDRKSSAFDGFDRQGDYVWMAEVAEESTHVWTHKTRIAVFLSAMRHFRDALLKEGFQVDYTELPHNPSAREPKTLSAALEQSIKRLSKKGFVPQELVLAEPGEYRVQEALRKTARKLKLKLDVRVDRHFFSSREDFSLHAQGRKQLRLEYFYRPLRKKYDILIDDGEPSGGRWNYDADNRGSFSKSGPTALPQPRSFRPDTVTRTVINLVDTRFASHPGELSHFDWPVTPANARMALKDFLNHRLVNFGRYQDAIWVGEPWLYHSRLSQDYPAPIVERFSSMERQKSIYEQAKREAEIRAPASGVKR